MVEATRVLLSGCYGRMANNVMRVIKSKANWKIVAGFDKEVKSTSNFLVTTDLSLSTSSSLELPYGTSLKLPNIIIDFSSPDATLEIVKFAKRFSIPTVIGTTGIPSDIQYQIDDLAKTTPVFQSANMSIGINLIQRALAMVAPNIRNSDIEILERHHNQKKDSPSGTAIMLANSINESLGSTMDIVANRQGQRNANEIGISSIRGGNIVGTHEVNFYGEYEDITITHTCHSREAFAEGAVHAAEWLLTQPPGLYNMDDLLTIN